MTPRRPFSGRIYPAAQVTAFLQATRDHEDHAVYALILATGCRIGEALALQWANVDLDPGKVIAASPAIGLDAKAVYQSWVQAFTILALTSTV